MQELIEGLEDKYNLEFRYIDQWLANIKLEKDYANTKLDHALNDILLDTEISYVIFYNYYIILYKNPQADIEKQKIRQFLSESQSTNATVIGSVEHFELGKQAKLNGTIRDIKTGDVIIGASVIIEELGTGTVSDINGKFSIAVSPGKYNVIVKYVNYDTEQISLNIVSDGRYDVELFESSITLEDVTIYSEAEDSNVSSTQSGTEMMSIEAIKELPTFLGEVDVIKSIQLLPGVTSVGEGATGFNVRGGSVDQNLVMLEGTQVFNYSHLLGFFSAFNPATVDDITLYRGGIPAKYGQRLSSILDVSMKDGNRDTYAVNGGIGMVSSHLMVEGPIMKDKSSFFVAGRSTYSDWVLNQINDVNVRNSSATFYDLTGRVTQRIGERGKLELNAYSSRDQFNLANDTTYTWATHLLSSRYNHLFNPTLVGNINIGMGSYEYGVHEPDQTVSFDLSFKIRYQQFDFNLEKLLGKNRLEVGFTTNLYQVSPGSIQAGSAESNVNAFSVDSEKAVESGLYLSGELEINPKVSLITGVRFSHYLSLGSGTTYLYSEDFPKETRYITDTLQHTSNEIIKPYFGIEPRVSARFLLNGQSSIKLGYNRIYQYIHLISNTTAVTPIDIWQLSNYHIKPQLGDQVSIGYFLNSRNNAYEFSSEIYYKTISNILEYKNGAELVLNPVLETDLIQGTGRAYGVELMVKKVKGRFTGWGSYTYSRSEHKIDNRFQSEQINQGEYFPSNYNKPHDLTLVGNYRFSLRFAFNFNFTYSTGRPITAPISKYSIGDLVINNYSQRNAYNIPDYHRLDIGFTINTNHKKDKFWEGYWNISVYNIYGRKNAYSVFFEESEIGKPTAKKLSVLGAPFPSVSYVFKI